MSSRFVAYYRVSTAKQGASGLGLGAQKRAVTDFLAGGTGELVGEFEEVESGKLDRRPQLEAAMDLCRLTGSRLIIAKLDRLSRDVHFLTGLEKQGVDFVACDMPTANRLTVHIMAAVAQQEREAISARTKAALGTIKSRLAGGEEYVSRRSGLVIKRLGNPAGLTVARPDLGTRAIVEKADRFAETVRPFIDRLRGEKLSLAAVASQLNAQHILTARGGAWTAMAVKRVLDRS